MSPSSTPVACHPEVRSPGSLPFEAPGSQPLGEQDQALHCRVNGIRLCPAVPLSGSAAHHPVISASSRQPPPSSQLSVSSCWDINSHGLAEAPWQRGAGGGGDGVGVVTGRKETRGSPLGSRSRAGLAEAWQRSGTGV